MQAYEYSHRSGIEELTWPRFVELAAALSEQLAPHAIQAVVGIARAGLFPATAVACALRCDIYPVRITRRENDLVVRDHPIWKVDLSPEVRGRTVAVIDEMADTGETLSLVAERARQMGAVRVLTAALAAHSWADPKPDFAPLPTDALVIFPWDRRVLIEGRWELHPELDQALRQQGRDPGHLDRQ